MQDRDPQALIPLTPATFHILLSLASGPMHGYGIKREVEERTGGVVQLGAGTLYAGIRRMESEGLIAETPPPQDVEADAGTRWRFYAITPFGSEVLALETRRLETDLLHARAVVPGGA